MIKPKPIDVWDLRTFDEKLLAELDTKRDLLRDYALTDRKLFLEREAATGWVPYPANPYASPRHRFVEHVIMPAMERRIIRAWHYTRLTDDEVASLRRGGVYVSTLESIRQRLDAQVALGAVPASIAGALFAASPFHDPHDARAGKFWMTSHPLSADNGGVQPLVGHWGGESVYFRLKDPRLVGLVRGLGRPRVIELAVPLGGTRHSYVAAKAIVATFVQALGCQPDGRHSISMRRTR